ncbi:MAG: hypothetical protein RL223_1142 [Pseudomonadota bacterium]|jgi:RND family efflux transporter MFP subunit
MPAARPAPLLPPPDPHGGSSCGSAAVLPLPPRSPARIGRPAASCVPPCVPRYLPPYLAVWIAGLFALVSALPSPAAAQAGAAGPAAVPAVASRHEGLVEPLRQTTVAAQVAGAVVELRVQAGDRVRAGQLLLRLDAQAARQADAASLAQVEAARAQADLARRDLQRQQALQQRQFISAAALERAQAADSAAEAQLQAVQAQSRLTRTQSGWTEIRAPYDAVVAAVPVAIGDMALPGRPLLQLHDPRRLRVSAALPLSVLAGLAPDAVLAVEVGGRRLPVSRWQRLPQADGASLTQTLRAELPPDTPDLVPGMVARLLLPAPSASSLPRPPATAPAGAPAAGGAGPAAPTLWRIPADAAGIQLPLAAIVRRGELTAVQVLDGEGRPLLRQVRLGRADGERVLVLSGLRPGEQVRVPAPLPAVSAPPAGVTEAAGAAGTDPRDRPAGPARASGAAR